MTRFDGSEGLSELFEYHVEAISKRQDIDFDKLIGKNCHVKLKSYGNVTRYFNGILVDADWSGVQQNLNAYRLVLRPWFWLLGRKATCRIFKEKSVFDIVEEVFQESGFKDFQIKASRGDYEKIAYCVQYRESDLAFVSRLLEEWGVYTHFEHDAQRHQLMLCDSRSCHKPMKAGGGMLPFVPLSGADRHDREHVSGWRAERRFRTGKFGTNDFDYMKPTANLKAEQQGSARYEKGTLESYDYPGRYTERDLGQRRTKVRLEAEQAQDKRKYASGDAASLFPGALATLQNHPSDNGEYLVVRATHRIETEAYRSGGSGGGDVYSGTYEFQPVDRPFRAPIVTPRPLVHGPQTALVVTRKGKESEEIDVDEEGRIFVQFHWNRDKDRISRPVRVAQQWSGKSWGWQVIPRVGQEVVVEFLEGDPDQPLVVGTVYNKDYPYPFKLPDEKTVSGVKTDSTKGHGGYNKLTFDDKKSSETIALRAEKDLEAVVRHAETREIGVTFETPQGKPSRSTTLKNGDEKLKVESGDWNVDIAEKIHIKAGTQIVIEVGASKITMSPSSIKIEAGEIKVQGTALIEQQAPLIKIN
ncbi:type VI secretion system tip protein VgrG [Methylobacterium sp. J-068]|nr:type VI secretion system tip protein VgrG [Methylobacterium sp. J-068]